MTEKSTKKDYARGKLNVARRAAERREKRGPNAFERKNQSVFVQMLGAIFGFGSHK